MNDKSLVTTDITDGFKTSLNLQRQELDQIQIEEISKDGTFERKDPQKTLQSYFEKANTSGFIKRTKRKNQVVEEQIEDDDSEEQITRNDYKNVRR